MKKFLFVFSIIFVPFCSIAQYISLENLNRELDSKSQKLIGQPFIDGKDRNAMLSSLNDKLKGKVILVNFWFATCQPCIKEFNALNKLNDKLRGNKNFELFAFTFETPETIEKVKQKYHLNYTIISIPEEECRKLLRVGGYPTNVILDKSGIIRFWKSSGEATEKERNVFITDSLYSKIIQEL